MYDTRSGEDPLFPTKLNTNQDFRQIQRIGKEFGTTTGRKRQVNWLNLTKLVNAANVTGTTHIVLNKCDILEELGKFKLIQEDYIEGRSSTLNFDDLAGMKQYISRYLEMNTSLTKDKIHYSFNPESI